MTTYEPEGPDFPEVEPAEQPVEPVEPLDGVQAKSDYAAVLGKAYERGGTPAGEVVKGRLS